MRIYFDTNVVISAFLTMGSSFDVITDAVEEHEVYYTDFLICEIERTLVGKLHFFRVSVKEKTNFIKKFFIKGKTAKEVTRICKDDSDNHILSDAILNEADFFITGDKEIIEIKQYKNMKIISPSEYWLILK